MQCSRAYALLRAGVPLTLLLDLWPDQGPDSREIMGHERYSAAVGAGAA